MNDRLTLPNIDAPHITTSAEQPAAVIALTVAREEMRAVMGPGVRELMATLAAQGVAAAGAWYTHHRTTDPEFFDFEIGVPVASAVAAAGRVRPGSLPAATVARTVYRGAYEGLSDAWQAFDAWIVAAGHTPAANSWECYEAGPESSADPAAWRTQLNRPLLAQAPIRRWRWQTR